MSEITIDYYIHYDKSKDSFAIVTNKAQEKSLLLRFKMTAKSISVKGYLSYAERGAVVDFNKFSDKNNLAYSKNAFAIQADNLNDKLEQIVYSAQHHIWNTFAFDNKIPTKKATMRMNTLIRSVVEVNQSDVDPQWPTGISVSQDTQRKGETKETVAQRYADYSESW